MDFLLCPFLLSLIFLYATLSFLNSRYDTMKFFCDLEKEEKIPKKTDGSIEFGVYHKPTSTKRCALQAIRKIRFNIN